MLLGGILTMNNLGQRKVMMVNACPMCLAEKESIDHLWLNCKTAESMWKLILGWFHCYEPCPNSIPSLFEYWRMGSKRGKSMRNLSFMAVVWSIWKERNRRCFDELSSKDNQLGENVKQIGAIWSSSLLHFKGISANSIIKLEGCFALLSTQTLHIS